MNPGTVGLLRNRFLQVFIAAGGYYVAGRLGLLLAIPPGYATAVWPASGIALGLVLLRGYGVWPGILIGSFFVNVGTSFDASTTDTIIKSVFIAFSIASGAALEAVAGGVLIRRLVGYSNIITQELDSIRMLLLGGPLSCMINSTVGVTTLWYVGLIPTPNYLFNWWTWWVGDSIGVIIFTPLVLVWALRPSEQWLRRQIALTIPLSIMFAMVVVLFFFTSSRENVRVQIEFDQLVDQYADSLRDDIDRHLDVLYEMEGFYASSQEVERDEFHTFAEKILVRHPRIQALSWNPQVQGEQRASFEASVRREGFPKFQISALDKARNMVPASHSAEYFPIDFIEPYVGNENALGFDVGFDPKRHRALNLSRDSGRPAGTRPLHLVQLTGDQPGMIVYMPIYRNDLPHETTEERRNNLRGYVAAVFRIEDMLQGSLHTIKSTGLQVRIYDMTAAQSPALIYTANSSAGEKEKTGGLHKTADINVAGPTWLLKFYLSPDYLVAHRSWQAWGLLATGLLFTGLLGMFLLVVIGRTTRIEDLVAQRTAELQRVNNNLNVEVQERKRLEQEAQSKATELSQKNEELEQFAYVASHDLQAPLRGVSGFAQLLQREYAEKLGKEGSEFIDFIINGTSQMHRLIGDLLQLSRIQTRAGGMSATDSSEVVRQALESMKLDISDAKAEIICQKLPMVWGDNGQLLQLFQNLVGNAIKFQKEGTRPRVEISALPEEEHWHFQIKDNGIGIPADQLPRLFVIFSRLHTTEAYPGTGIGLAICKKIVERHFGKIWVESAPDAGTTFHFTLPAVRSPQTA